MARWTENGGFGACWEHALAVVLVLGATYALVRFAGRVYAKGLLHGGSAIGARAAWRLARDR